MRDFSSSRSCNLRLTVGPVGHGCIRGGAPHLSVTSCETRVLGFGSGVFVGVLVRSRSVPGE